MNLTQRVGLQETRDAFYEMHTEALTREMRDGCSRIRLPGEDTDMKPPRKFMQSIFCYLH